MKGSMKHLKYILPLFCFMALVSCDKSELESPDGQYSAKLLPVDHEEGRTVDGVRSFDRNHDIRSSGVDINDDGDDETGNGKPSKKE